MASTRVVSSRFRSEIRRLALAALVLAVSVSVLFVMRLASANLQRIESIEVGLQQSGQFSESRRRIQRWAFESLPGASTAESALIVDLRLQIEQALLLADRLPPPTAERLRSVQQRLAQPVIYQSDLLAASRVMEEVIDAESAIQTQVMEEARQGLLRQRAFAVGALLVIAVVALAGLWRAPDRILEPLRAELRRTTRAVAAQGRALGRAQQLSLMGERAAALAHEVRNPLAGVIMGLHNVQTATPELNDRIQPMVGELERVSRTLSTFLQSVDDPREPAVSVDPESLLRRMAVLLSLQAPKGVRVEVAAGGDPVHVPRDTLQQVLLNLSLNGLQAMEGVKRGVLRIEGRAEDRAAVFTVSDDGPGFPPDVLSGERPIFESDREEGTGLGLGVVRRLTASMGGEVELSNRPGGGAMARIVIPRADGGAA